MDKILIVVDMQNDFVFGSLGSDMAKSIVNSIILKVMSAHEKNDTVIFTRDTHGNNYVNTLEGKYLPVIHCIKGEEGWNIVSPLMNIINSNDIIIDKPTFGSVELINKLISINSVNKIDEIELCGVCTDICVLSNASLIKSFLPEVNIVVNSNLCAGTTLENHKAALLVLKSLQVNVC